MFFCGSLYIEYSKYTEVDHYPIFSCPFSWHRNLAANEASTPRVPAVFFAGIELLILVVLCMPGRDPVGCVHPLAIFRYRA